MLFMLALSSMTVVFAMGPGSMGGPGKGNMDKMQNSYGMGKFNKNTIVTIDATVEEVGSNEGGGANGGIGAHLYVTSRLGYTKVHVSPQFWIDANNITFSKGEKIEITGSRFEGKGKDSGDNIYAVTITKADGTLYKFRDPQTGAGLWKQGMAKLQQEKMMKQMQEENQKAPKEAQ